MRRRYCRLYILLVLILILNFIVRSYDVPWSDPNCNSSGEKTAMDSIAKLQSKYIIRTPLCKIRRVDAFNKLVLHEYRSVERQICSNSGEPTVIIQDKKISVDLTNSSNYKSCCYRSVGRLEHKRSNTYIFSDWLPSNSRKCFPIPPSGATATLFSPFVRFECSKTDKFLLVTPKTNISKIKPYTDFAATVFSPHSHSLQSRKKAIYWDQLVNSSLNIPPNILLLGIDGISRLHMKRSLPNTRKFALNNDFIELKGFTSTHGLTTFGNLMAIFTGQLGTTYPCYKGKMHDPLDNCPFIWKNFSSNKYMTGLVQDSPGLSDFNRIKLGFIKQPVDYTLRTLLVAVQREFKPRETNRWPFIPLTECVNGINIVDTMFKYIKDFVKTVGQTYPYFLTALFRTITPIYRDGFSAIEREDNNFLNLLQNILENGSNIGENNISNANSNLSSKSNSSNSNRRNVNNTVIILFSTHGHAYENNENKHTFESAHEEALPVILVRIPPSLKISNPDWYQNLIVNAERLTSTLDIHATLEDILSLSSTSSWDKPFKFTHFNRQPDSPLSSGGQLLNRVAYSLFEEIPINRSCESARIPEPYCRCGATPLVTRHPNSTFSNRLSDAIVTYVNLILADMISSELCSELKSNRVLYGRRTNFGVMGGGNGFSTNINYTNTNTTGNGSASNNTSMGIRFKDYLLGIEVMPSLAQFEATVRQFKVPGGTNRIYTVISEVTRQNSYGNQSYCVEPKLKIYCMCREAGVMNLESKIKNFSDVMKRSSGVLSDAPL